MAYNKIIYKDNVLMDITDSTVTPETLNKGIVAYGANGERIIGTNVGGGSGVSSGWKYATGKFTPTTTGGYTVVHNLGVMPDFVMVWAATTVTTAKGVVFANGFSQEVFDVAGDSLQASCSVYSTAGTGQALTWGVSYPMTSDNSTMKNVGCPCMPTETSFRVGDGSLGMMIAGVTYEWVAFGGVFGSEQS